jgi:hypothetical protein
MTDQERKDEIERIISYLKEFGNTTCSNGLLAYYGPDGLIRQLRERNILSNFSVGDSGDPIIREQIQPMSSDEYAERIRKLHE